MSDKNEIKKRVGSMLEMVQLTGMERRNPKQLSGGQQQRVAWPVHWSKCPKCCCSMSRSAHWI